MAEEAIEITKPVEDQDYVHPLKKEDLEGVRIPVANQPGVDRKSVV